MVDGPCRARCLALAGCALLIPGLVSASTLTVLVDYDRPAAPATVKALESELASIMAASEIRVSLKNRAELADHEQFENVVLFHMRGTCSMKAMPVGALSDERGPLAMTYSVNGELLPFGEVQCDRVRASVRRTVGLSDPEAHEPEFGVALARVMAHEVYHMVAHTADHSHAGVAKAALSSRELTGKRLDLDPAAKSAIQTPPQ